MMHGQNTSNQK